MTHSMKSIWTLPHHSNNEHQIAIREALHKFHAALNDVFTGDVQPMIAVWSHADDVTYQGPNGAYRKGWDEVYADWEAQAAMNLGGRVEPQELRMVSGPEIAVVHNIVKGTNLDIDGNPFDVSLRATVVLRREDGTWKVVGVHTDLLPNLAN